MYDFAMLLQLFLIERLGPPHFSSVLHSGNVCIMLQECPALATRPDGERWCNPQINQKYIGNIKQTSISNKSLQTLGMDVLCLCIITSYNFTIEFNCQEH